MAIDAEFAAPAAAKELGDEVKAAKAWLQSRTTALVPQSLDRDMRPIVPEHGPVASGGFPLMIEDVPRGALRDGEERVSCSWFTLCVVDNGIDIEPMQTPEDSEVVREVPAPPAPIPNVSTPNVSTLVAGTKRRLFLSSDDEEHTPKKAKNSPKAKSSKCSDDDRDDSSPSPEPPAVEPPSAKRRKAKASSAVSELDMTPQAVTKHGYPEGAYLLNSKIYIGVRFSLPPFVVRFADLGGFIARGDHSFGDVSVVYQVWSHLQWGCWQGVWPMYSGSAGMHFAGG
jgi:hypothetical protein